MKNKAVLASIAIFAAVLVSCGTTEKKPQKADKIKDGIGKTYWDDGSVRGEGNFKNFQKDGKWTLFQKGSTAKLAEGNYANDNQNGPWVFYHKNGAKSSEGSFEDNQKTGQWTNYYETGEKMWEAKYVIRNTETGKIGGIEGTKITYYVSGKVKQEEEYVNGEKKGKNQEYYESGKPKEISWYNNNKRNGNCNVYWETGGVREQGMYQDDLKNGAWKVFYDNSQLYMTGSFIIGKLLVKGEEQPVSQMSGPWQFYSKEGLLQKEGVYEKGKETGLWKFYSYQNKTKRLLGMELTLKGGMAGGTGKIYENGALIATGNIMGSVKGIYEKHVNGKSAGEESSIDVPSDNPKENTTYKWTGKWHLPKKNGAWTEYYPGGKNIKLEVTYMMDKFSGKYKEYFPNGKVKAEGEYMNDKKNGLWKVYNENGTLNEEESGRWMLGKKSKI